MACCGAVDMGNTAVLAASVALKGWWRNWSDWQWNDRSAALYQQQELLPDVGIFGNFREHKTFEPSMNFQIIPLASGNK